MSFRHPINYNVCDKVLSSATGGEMGGGKRQLLGELAERCPEDFENYFEFEGCVDYFLKNKENSSLMGRNGRKYVTDNFSCFISNI